jgi:hypothetical protein
VEAGEKVLDSDNTIPVLSTVPNTINHEFEHECLNVVVRLLNAHPISQSTDVCVPHHMDSVLGLSRTMFQAHQDCAS